MALSTPPLAFLAGACASGQTGTATSDASRYPTAPPGFRRNLLSGARNGKRPTMPVLMHPPPRTATLRNPTIMPTVKRYNGRSRSAASWDGLRRDKELWHTEGNCFVHLHSKGQSRRGPAICIPKEALGLARCGPLNDQVISETSVDGKQQFSLYLPAPDHYSRKSAFQYHITTRNFFAFLFGRPLAGTSLGTALADLQARLADYRDADVEILEELRGYARAMGYMSFAHCPDHALALLYYAEEFQIRELWIDAFAHCVGMNEELDLSEEFHLISQATKSQITKTFLEVEVHLERVEDAMSTFLEEEMSSAKLGLSAGARDHLDRFRSFLHAYYVRRYGYWPPMSIQAFNKELYTSMYFDFRNLYDYLVDNESTDSRATLKPASGGICVLQNVQAFDQRNRYEPLPHPLPLMPELPRDKSQNGRRNIMGLNSRKKKAEECAAQLKALMAATNSKNREATSSAFVREYMYLEKECCERSDERVSFSDARKVRWILTYGILQMLIHAIRAPPEVRNTKGVSYSLCCMASPTPSWLLASKLSLPPSPLTPCSVTTTISASNFTHSDTVYASDYVGSPIEPDAQMSDFYSAERCSPNTIERPPFSRTVSDNPSESSASITPDIVRKDTTTTKRRFSPLAFVKRESVQSPALASPPDETLFRAYKNTLDIAARPGTSHTVRPDTIPRSPTLDMSQINARQPQGHVPQAIHSPISASSSKSSSFSSPMFSENSITASPASSVGSVRRHSISSISNGAHSQETPLVQVTPKASAPSSTADQLRDTSPLQSTGESNVVAPIPSSPQSSMKIQTAITRLKKLDLSSPIHHPQPLQNDDFDDFDDIVDTSAPPAPVPLRRRDRRAAQLAAYQAFSTYAEPIPSPQLASVASSLRSVKSARHPLTQDSESHSRSPELPLPSKHTPGTAASARKPTYEVRAAPCAPSLPSQMDLGSGIFVQTTISTVTTTISDRNDHFDDNDLTPRNTKMLLPPEPRSPGPGKPRVSVSCEELRREALPFEFEDGPPSPEMPGMKKGRFNVFGGGKGIKGLRSQGTVDGLRNRSGV